MSLLWPDGGSKGQVDGGFRAQTNDGGYFTLGPVAPGAYQVSFSRVIAKAGFGSLTYQTLYPSVQLASDASCSLNGYPELGEVACPSPTVLTASQQILATMACDPKLPASVAMVGDGGGLVFELPDGGIELYPLSGAPRSTFGGASLGGFQLLPESALALVRYDSLSPSNSDVEVLNLTDGGSYPFEEFTNGGQQESAVPDITTWWLSPDGSVFAFETGLCNPIGSGNNQRCDLYFAPTSTGVALQTGALLYQTGTGPLLQFSPDSQYVAWVVPNPNGDPSYYGELNLAATDGGYPEPVPVGGFSNDPEFASIAFSADSSTLALCEGNLVELLSPATWVATGDAGLRSIPLECSRMAFSADGSRLLVEGNSALTLVATKSFSTVPVSAAAVRGSSAFSNDGALLAFLADAGASEPELEVVYSADGGAAFNPALGVGSFQFSPDDRLLAARLPSRTGPEGLELVSAVTGAITPEAPGLGGGLLFSTDGAHVAYLSALTAQSGFLYGSSLGPLYLGPTDGGSPLLIGQNALTPGGFAFTPDGKALYFLDNVTPSESGQELIGTLEVIAASGGPIYTVNTNIQAPLSPLGPVLPTARCDPGSDISSGLYTMPLP